MLRSVLENYLKNVTERDFDLPFLAILPAMGFYDIHYTHGHAEFGKDFIAKKIENGITYQYSFQSKAGDIDQSAWREIQLQMFEAVINTLAHPNFDTGLPQKVFLVTTGELVGNAGLAWQNFNQRLQTDYNKPPIELWDKQNLLVFLEVYGISSVHNSTGVDFISFGNFYRIYGKSLQDYISEREIEEYSRQWLDKSLDLNKRLRLAAIEGQIIATNCLEQGYIYEAIHIYLAVSRTVFYEAQKATDIVIELLDTYNQLLEILFTYCKKYFSDFRAAWIKANRNLASINQGLMMSYLVHCARVLEISALLYFLAKQKGQSKLQKDVSKFIQEFTELEPGSYHIPADRYAIGLVLASLVLIDSKHKDKAQSFLHKNLVWLCDRFEEGEGIASVDASEETEVNTLLGYAFEFIKVQKSVDCLTASAICDLAVFLGQTQFYEDVVNDIKAVGIMAAYWSAPDTEDLLRIEGEEVIHHGNLSYSENFLPFTSFDFAQHIREEPSNYKLSRLANFGPFSLVLIALLLRDRYFPKIWPLIVAYH